MYTKKTILINNKELILEYGRIAKNTSASIFAELDGTALLVSVVHQDSNEKDFLPLKVEYFERFYASRKIPCNYFKREGRPSEREILIARLIDRAIRPTFPKYFNNEVQITITVMSINPQIDPDIIAIIATSAALAKSGLSCETIISAVRVSYKNKLFYINPSSSNLKGSDLELIIAGTEDKILMIEANANEIEDHILSKAIELGSNTFKDTIKILNEFKNYKDSKNINNNNFNLKLYNSLLNEYKNILIDIYDTNDLLERKEHLNKFYNDIILKYTNDDIDIKSKKSIYSMIKQIERYICRNIYLKNEKRLDNRQKTEIRQIFINTNLLKNIHGSSLFTRGETQAIVSITLGFPNDAQMVDCVFKSNQRHKFILHYNFPPYAVNEIGNLNIVKRREIGHGNLAKQALKPVLPQEDNSSYVIRIVSEITESNGSSSMATVCGGSLALMDAGIPIKNHVAGIAMGLIKEDNKYIILSDISGEEDHIGDMDFKIAGTTKGITAVQMDVKTQGVERHILNEIISQSTEGIKHILDIMYKHISKPCKRLSDNIPKIKKIKIDKRKIKDVIGKGGIIIKSLTENFKCKINVNNDGDIIISSMNIDNIDKVIYEIKKLTKDINIGDIYKGKVMKLTQFGAFINILPQKDGLLHISKINKYKLNNPNWEITEDLLLKVIISKIDEKGKISLNIN